MAGRSVATGGVPSERPHPDAAAPHARQRHTLRSPLPMSAPTRTQHAAKRYIYSWGDGRAEGNGTMKDLLGGKGAGLAEMTNAGLPGHPASPSRPKPATTTSPPASSCPPGCGRTSWRPSRRSRSRPARASATPANPLLVSVRSGAKFSMPGMMDTVLNLGLNEETLKGLIALHRQRALRLRRLSTVHPDVRQDRPGHRGQQVREIF